MSLVKMKDLLDHAYENHYAVGAFEIINMEFLRAVITAAEESRSPVILNVVEAHFNLFDVKMLMPAVVDAAKRSSVPVAINMDHCSTQQSVQTAISLGCNGVMYEDSGDYLPDIIKHTQQVVELAHNCGVPVEGALGHVAGVNSSNDDDESTKTSAAEAEVFVERTGIDFLSISIGTMHGSTNGKLKLDYTRLAKINDSVKIPLVIHGGTGLTSQQYQKLIDNGVAKINYFTALSEIYACTIKSNLSNGKNDYASMIDHVQDEMSAEVQRMMQAWRSAGRAAEVMIQCNTWNNVEHVILYNSQNESDPTVTQIMLRKGKQLLAEIPGVMDVRIGRTTSDDNSHHYCWLVRFTHESVIKTYENHPLHKEFADSYFLPVTADRVTNDFEILDELDLERQLHD